MMIKRERRLVVGHLAGVAALAAIVALSGCGATRLPEGDARRIGDEQLITMTHDHLTAFGMGMSW